MQDKSTPPEDDRLQVDSKERARGSDIVVDEADLPSRAMATHESIRQEGEKELEREPLALFWSGVAAGLSMGASFLARGLFTRYLEGVPGHFLLENLGYSFGFMIVILARQQLFTENTVTAVLPVMQLPTRSNILLLLRLWGVVLAGNLIGTVVVAFTFSVMPGFDAPTQEAFLTSGLEIMHKSPGEMLVSAMLAGWIIATMVWMLPAAGSAKIVVIILMTWLMALSHTAHIVVGSVEILYLAMRDVIPWHDFFWPFALPTLAGNILGGTFIFALLSHVQIRNDRAAIPAKYPRGKEPWRFKKPQR
ncbi:formate/nitrite transporter family protein [Mangrovibacter yixingensis]|uniref:formate/nitrite transporter family protein n=1 Tax=Mangrovibacter yixingensis TaxID=1529639 RepID=UPI001CFECE95|nr:formate/nitrite transporter family protein [Mangrovibacter yixingensis]